MKFGHTLDFRPSLQIASQSSLDCSEAQGLVSSIYNEQIGQYTCPETSPTLSREMTHVVHTEIIQSLGDLNLLLGVEESIGELLTLTEGGFNDLESRDIAQEVGDTDAVAVGVTGGVRVVASLYSSEAGVIGFSKKSVEEVNRWISQLPPTIINVLAIGTVGLPIGLVLCTGAHCGKVYGGVMSSLR